MKFMITVFALVLGLSFTAQAAEKGEKKAAKKASSSDSYGGEVPWGMAGCSIWNWVIKDKEQGPQIGVWALEHFVFGVQTFAITSGTSNCVEGASKTAMTEQETFVTVNLATLQREAAQGKGEHLDTLAEIFGCESKEGFANMSQNRYEALFSNENPQAVLNSYKSEVKAANMACRRVI
jgi:hypothetical protein